MSASPEDSSGVFKAQEGQVYQIPTLPMMHSAINPITGAIYTDTLLATENGVSAKNAFVFNTGKHPTRNIFAFYRREIGDVIFDIDDWDQESVAVIQKQDWMDRSEQDAIAEIDARAEDPTTQVEEIILESILGIPSKPVTAGKLEGSAQS
jgi:hypothetical protein